MYGSAASRLRASRPRSWTGASARFASSSAVTTTKQSSSGLGGIFDWLTGERTVPLPPLDFPLPGVTLPPPLPDHVEPGKTKITTLSNGVKVASETSAAPAASIGLYIDWGSIYETILSSGATHLLERTAFKSTRNRSHFRIVREVEAIGGNVQASASREQIGYTFDALKTYVPEMVELLIDCVRNPVFLDWEVNEEILQVKAEINEASKNPQDLLLEAIHSAGFVGALANPLLAQESAINRLNGTILEEFVADSYTAPLMVLAAKGVDHEEFLTIAEPLLSDLPRVPYLEEPKSVYTGGDYRCQNESGMTRFALGFQLPGGWHKLKEAMILTVLRCYWEVAVHSQLVDPVKGSDFASKAIDIAVDELLAVATPGQVDQVQLDRAKQATKSAILMNLESRMIVAEDIGRQILTYGERKPVENFLKAVDEVTLNDIASISQKLISSPFTMASHGDVVYVPSYMIRCAASSIQNENLS